MKKFMKSLMLVAVAAMGFTACTNDMLDNVNKNTEETFTLTISSEKPALEGTRTEFSNGSIIWNQGDNIRATFNRGTEWGKYYASTTQSNEIATDGKTAKFTIGTTFTSSGSGEFTFYAGYPQNAIGSGTTAPTEGILGVTVPTEQTMTKMSTFDASADIMVGKSTQTYAEVTQTIPFHWTRLVSHACVTLKNLAAQEGEIVKNVTFTAPEGVALTGKGDVNFVEQSMTALDNNTVTVNLPANTTAKVAELPVWFCSAPETITAGNNLVVTVETTRGTYTRTITARSEGIKFIQNNYCTLGINMAEAEFTPVATSANVYQLITSVDELTTGEYVVTAKYNNAYYPMASPISITSGRIDAKTTISVTSDQITETDADGYIYTITVSSSGASIYDGANYLGGSTSDTNLTKSSTVFNWAVTYENNHFEFTTNSAANGIMYNHNNGNGGRFKSYKATNFTSATYSGLYLFKKVSNNPDAPTLSLDKNAVEFEHAGGTATITATTTNYNGQITATSSNAHFTTSVNGNVVTVTAPANTEETVKTATITITAGTLSKEVAVSQAAKIVLSGAGNADSPYTVADALKLIAANQHDTTKEVYVEGVVSYIKEAYNADYGNANYNISDNGEDTNSLNIYRGFYIDGADFTAENQLSLGDKVVVKGKLSVYGTTSQFAQGSQVVSVVKAGGSEEPTAPVALATPEVSATVHGTTVNVSWDTIEGAGSYVVTLGTATQTVTTTSAEFTNVAAGTYTALVVAKPSNTTTHTDSAAGQSASVTVEEQGGGEDTTKYYVKVTSAPSDWSGTYLIVYGAENMIFNGSLTTLDATNNYQTVAITDNKIIAEGNTAYQFTIEKYSTGYSIKAASGKYIGHASNDNKLTSSSTALVNTITFKSADEINIVCAGGAYLRFNTTSGQDRFRYFKSGTYTNQQAIQLYKLAE